jgi:hypothetical protein
MLVLSRLCAHSLFTFFKKKILFSRSILIYQSRFLYLFLLQDSPSFMSNDSSVHTPNDEPAITESMKEEEEKLQTETEKENLKVLKEKVC